MKQDGTFAEKRYYSSRIEFSFILQTGVEILPRDVNRAETTLKSCEIVIFLHQ